MAVQDGYGKSSGVESLVFAYDLKDTINSYRGEPTTNIATNTPLQGGWGGGYTLLNGETKSFRFYMNSWSATPGASWRSFLWDVSEYSGQLVTISATFESANESSADFSWILIGETTGAQTYLGYSDGLHRNQKTTTDRERISWSGTVEDGQKVGFTVWADNGTGTFSVDVSNVQIEIGKTHPTPFINGSRSVTQGLLDLTSNSTIDLSNVSFDGDTQMTFDGTNDYVTSTHSSGQEPLNNVTFETIVKLTSTSNYKGMFMKSNYQNPNGYIAVHTTGNGYMRLECSDTLGSVRHLDTASIGTNTRFTPNETVHFTLTYDGTNIRTYINSVLKDTYTWTYGLGNNQGNLELGRFWAGSWSGDIYQFKQFNRELTETEIQNNYLKYRGLYGLG